MRPALLILLLLFATGDGSRQGRRGNALYARGQYEAAAAAYQQGLDATGPGGALRAALWNNLGAARYRQGQAAEARAAFEQSLAAAATAAEAARAAYNAGNAAYAAQDLNAALAFYRQALRIDPTHQDAKFNYEFVLRRRPPPQQQPQGGQEGDQNPQDDPGSSQGASSSDGEDPAEQPPPDGADPAEGNADPAEGGPAARPQPQPGQLSREQAERILQALNTDEEQLLRALKRRPEQPRRVEKDW